MNLALFEGPGVLAPLNGLMNWLIPSLAPHHHSTQISAEKSKNGFKVHAKESKTSLAEVEVQQTPRASAHRPLRIVRILEANHSPANVGRMVISGRMSDVCAELDRLVARETALH